MQAILKAADTSHINILSHSQVCTLTHKHTSVLISSNSHNHSGWRKYYNNHKNLLQSTSKISNLKCRKRWTFKESWLEKYILIYLNMFHNKLFLCFSYFVAQMESLCAHQCEELHKDKSMHFSVGQRKFIQPPQITTRVQLVAPDGDEYQKISSASSMEPR